MTYTKSCLILYYNGDESYFFVNKTEICKFQLKDNISWYNFCLESVSEDLTKGKQSEISLNGNLYDFSVDHSTNKWLLYQKMCTLITELT